ncbi:MAG: hypothetical protein ACMXYE_01760 [Candidatus Woesearchaeota archaeon]
MRLESISPDEIDLTRIGELESVTSVLPRGGMNLLTELPEIVSYDDKTEGNGLRGRIYGLFNLAEHRHTIEKFHANALQGYVSPVGEEGSVFPGYLLLDALFQQTGFFMPWAGCTGKGRAMGLTDVSFPSGASLDEEVIHYSVDVLRLNENSRLSLITADGVATTSAGKILCTAKGLKVGMYGDFEKTDFCLDGIKDEAVPFFSDKPLVKDDGAYAHWRVDQSAWFFRDHFHNDPVMPGCLGVQALWNLCKEYFDSHGGSDMYSIDGAGKLDFRKEVLPSSSLVEYEIKNVRLNGLQLQADGVVHIDCDKAYSVKDLTITSR